ncbi:MAG TPA: DUF222 domain-containing protein [Kofleriaceae bacterium]|nr:DUF222 domain-containing protein [Kofleriaceae bacterium]
MNRERCLSMEEIAAMGEAIAETAAIIDVATHRFLTQLREFDAVDGWHRAGALSCAHWLSWRVGMDLGAAREKVRVARALGELQAIDAALRRGEISYSKVRAMTRVATEKNEEQLLVMARSATGAQLEKIYRLKRSVDGLDREAREVEARRYVVERATGDGMVSIQLRLLPDEAARVMKAMEVAGSGNRADGVVALAEMALAGGRREGSVRPPVEVVLHVQAADLEGRTELGDGISAEVCQRVLCDAGVVPMLEDAEGKTIDVGRKTRTIPAALRRALDARDSGCRFPGCTNRIFTDGHHIQHWLEGGETSLENTVLLCRRHHRYVHEHGFSLERVGEALVFRDPGGRVLPPQGPRCGVAVNLGALAGAWSGAPVTAEVNAPGWDGERVDYDLCVAALG